MRVAIPHELPREEVRQRMHDNMGKLSDKIPGGKAEVHTNWTSEDRLELAVGVLNTSVNAVVEIEDAQIVLEVALPPALGFVEPMVQTVLRQQGQKLLAPKD